MPASKPAIEITKLLVGLFSTTSWHSLEQSQETSVAKTRGDEDHLTIDDALTLLNYWRQAAAAKGAPLPWPDVHSLLIPILPDRLSPNGAGRLNVSREWLERRYPDPQQFWAQLRSWAKALDANNSVGMPPAFTIAKTVNERWGPLAQDYLAYKFGRRKPATSGPPAWVYLLLIYAIVRKD